MPKSMAKTSGWDGNCKLITNRFPNNLEKTIPIDLKIYFADRIVRESERNSSKKISIIFNAYFEKFHFCCKIFEVQLNANKAMF